MMYQKIKLLNGTVVVPDDCIVVEETKTEKSNYVGIVAEKTGHYRII